MKKLFLLLLVTCIFASVVSAQVRMAGKVVQVIDGRSLIVETNAGMLTVQLQYLEIPEHDQPFFGVAKEHLSKLTLGKSVEFKPLRIFAGRTIGQTTMDGVDLSLQMIRDGAAWHEPEEISGQSSSEASDYEKNQQLAKAEKRGVWSGAGLKPPWQVRAEEQERIRAAEQAARKLKPTLTGVSQYQTARRIGGGPPTISKNFEMGAWADVFGGVGKESAGLMTYKDPRGAFDVLYTSIAFVHLKDGAKTQKVECRVGYLTYRLLSGTTASYYVMVFRSISEDYDFSTKRSVMTVMADGRAASLGRAFGFKGREYFGAHELFFYRIGMPTLKKMSSAEKVELRVNRYIGVFPEDAKRLFGQLVAATQ